MTYHKYPMTESNNKKIHNKQDVYLSSLSVGRQVVTWNDKKSTDINYIREKTFAISVPKYNIYRVIIRIYK